MVPLQDIDEPLREEVRGLVLGVVRDALAGVPSLGLGPVAETEIEINEANTKVPLRPLHTWCVTMCERKST